MNGTEAIQVFEGVRGNYDIPPEAELDFVEKRYIELPVDTDADPSLPIRDELVWVGRYSLGVRFYELTCDMTGTIVRFEKSRSGTAP
jgi:hypothetical protein